MKLDASSENYVNPHAHQPLNGRVDFEPAVWINALIRRRREFRPEVEVLSFSAEKMQRWIYVGRSNRLCGCESCRGCEEKLRRIACAAQHPSRRHSNH